MPVNYDNWGKLVEAVMRREKFRQLSLEDSRSPSTLSSDSDSTSNLSSRYDDGSSRPTPEAAKLGFAESLKEGKHRGSKTAKRMGIISKGLSIFRGFSAKREKRQLQWTEPRRTFHGHQSVETSDIFSHMSYEVSSIAVKRKAELSRLQKMCTLKGHIESQLKLKGIDLNSVPYSYTI